MVQDTLPHVIDAISISRSSVGTQVFILRIWLISKDATLPFEMRRKQFPVKLAYSMTANKAQGQTLAFVGIFIAREFFSQGEFYVAMLRVGRMDCVKILFKKENNYHVKHVVYREVLQNLYLLISLSKYPHICFLLFHQNLKGLFDPLLSLLCGAGLLHISLRINIYLKRALQKLNKRIRNTKKIKENK